MFPGWRFLVINVRDDRQTDEQGFLVGIVIGQFGNRIEKSLLDVDFGSLTRNFLLLDRFSDGNEHVAAIATVNPDALPQCFDALHGTRQIVARVLVLGA
jgi:hypothetical protein